MLRTKMHDLSIQQSVCHRALRSLTTVTDTPPLEYDSSIKALVDFIRGDPNSQSLRRSLAHALAAKNCLDDAISMWWELVYEDPRDIRNLSGLYAANRRKYRLEVKVSFGSHLYFLFLYVISRVSCLLLKWGFGELDWWPVVSTEELMMLQPFMEKRMYFYVPSLSRSVRCVTDIRRNERVYLVLIGPKSQGK